MSATMSTPRCERTEAIASSKRVRDVDVQCLKDISTQLEVGQIFLLRGESSGVGGCLGVLLGKDAEAGVGYLHPIYTPPYEGFGDEVEEDVVVRGDALKLAYVSNVVVRPSVGARVPLAALHEVVGQISSEKVKELQRWATSRPRNVALHEELLQAWAHKIDVLLR